MVTPKGNMSTEGETLQVSVLLYRCSICPPLVTHTLHVCGRNLITGLTSAASPRVDISNICKVGQKLGVSLPLCWHAPLRRDHPGYCTAEFGNPGGGLWITLYSLSNSSGSLLTAEKSLTSVPKITFWNPTGKCRGLHLRHFPVLSTSKTNTGIVRWAAPWSLLSH